VDNLSYDNILQSDFHFLSLSFSFSTSSGVGTRPSNWKVFNPQQHPSPA
jgi:hypothetical protein